MREKLLTALYRLPSVVTLQALLDACCGRGLLTSLKFVQIGGEAVLPTAIAALYTAAPSTRIFQIYGELSHHHCTADDVHVTLAVTQSSSLLWGLHLDTRYPLALPCRPQRDNMHHQLRAPQQGSTEGALPSSRKVHLQKMLSVRVLSVGSGQHYSLPSAHVCLMPAGL